MTTTTNWEKETITNLLDKCVHEYRECVAEGVVTDEETKVYLIAKIQKLLAQQRQELLDQFEQEVIGKTNPAWHDDIEMFRNGLRAEQLEKLSALRLEGGKK